MDVNIGMLWSKTFGKFTPEIGVSVFHVNFPKESFFENDENLSLRKVFSFATKINLGTSFFLKPHILQMSQKSARDLVLGTNIGYNIPKNIFKAKAIFIGSFFRSGIGRNADALYYVVGMNFKTFDIGLSYDFNVSNLSTATHSKGAFEISFVYTSASTILNQIDIPCDRF